MTEITEVGPELGVSFASVREAIPIASVVGLTASLPRAIRVFVSSTFRDMQTGGYPESWNHSQKAVG